MQIILLFCYLSAMQNHTQTTAKTKSLIPYCKNARTHSASQLELIKKSIEEYGFTNPILIDEDFGVVAGHGRLAAASALGIEEVPVVVLKGLTEAQKRAYVLADNKIALEAGWDDALLISELQDLKVDGFDMSLTGFSFDEINDLLDIRPVEQEEEDSEEESMNGDQKPIITCQGDIWICGDHVLMCGDSTNIGAVQELVGAGITVQLLLTDPPYNAAYEGKTKDSLKIQNDSMDGDKFRQFLTDAFIAADAVMAPGACFYVWFSSREAVNFRISLEAAIGEIRQELLWKKSTLVLGRQDYQQMHEPCLYGWKEGAAHKWESDRKQTTILEFDKPSRNGDHPTMKPVDLFQYQICNSSSKGDIVLDLFGGSGTTMIACEQSKRKARIMELDPKYCDVIVRRWQNLTGKDAVRKSDGVIFSSLDV